VSAPPPAGGATAGGATAGAFRLAGRVAVVTGASSGIGWAVALRLVAEGARVTAVGRDKKRLDALAAAAATAAQSETTCSPTTQNPATHSPTAQNPIAQNPATQSPPTQIPTRQSPVTQSPTTQSPTTQDLATQDPARQSSARQSSGTRRVADGPGELHLAQVDLTDDDARRALVAGLGAGPRVDVLVHSAGGYANGPHAEAPLGDLDWLYEANVRAPYALTQELLPALRAGGGDIVVINSSQGLRAGASLGQFAATQQAMKAITDSLRQEINAAGVRVCGIHPGRTATPRQEALFAQEGRPYQPELLLAADDVAEVVAGVLALPRNAEITEVHLRPAAKSY
jgi:NADP-dependent 3-hydroxy acid dehydrogenase YdfG